MCSSDLRNKVIPPMLVSPLTTALFLCDRFPEEGVRGMGMNECNDERDDDDVGRKGKQEEEASVPTHHDFGLGETEARNAHVSYKKIGTIWSDRNGNSNSESCWNGWGSPLGYKS